MDSIYLVSVIIPCHNSEEFIIKALYSVLSQLYKNFEVIIVDDGSTDNTKEILQDYIQNGQIQYFYQDNTGPAAARNNGIRHARGEFVAFLDADDVWLPTKLEEQMQLFSDRNVGLVCSGREFINEQGKSLGSESIQLYKGFVTKQLINANFITNSSVVVRKNVFDEVGYFNESKEIFSIEDYEMWLRISLRYKFDYISDPLVGYRIHESQISKNPKITHSRLAYMYKVFLTTPSFKGFRFDIFVKWLKTKIASMI